MVIPINIDKMVIKTTVQYALCDMVEKILMLLRIRYLFLLVTGVNTIEYLKLPLVSCSQSVVQEPIPRNHGVLKNHNVL